MFLIEKLPKDTSDAVDEPLGIAMTLGFLFPVEFGHQSSIASIFLVHSR